MAGLEAVAGQVVTALVTGVLEKAISHGHEFLSASPELKTAVSVLQTKLVGVKDIVAETKQPPSWMAGLEDAAYEAEAVLDEIEYERLKRQVNKFNFPSIFNKRSLLSTVRDIETRLDKILATAITVEKLRKKLKDNSTPKRVSSSNPRETTSPIDSEQLLGRDDVRDRIIHWLLDGVDKPLEAHEKSFVTVYTNLGKDVPVLAIYGIGGVGKTTLAQHIFNNENVELHFEGKAWVYVSETFNTKKIMKDIIQSRAVSMYHKTRTENWGLDRKHQSRNFSEVGTSQRNTLTRDDELEDLSQELINMLTGKRFLIILDDVWNDDEEIWNTLRKCFRHGKSGSKIIITCRSEKVVKLMSTPNVAILLDGLDKDNYWSLLKKYAIGEQSMPSKFSQEFESIGQQIAEKLKGSPLAAKAIGAILKSKLDIAHWREVLENDIWKQKQGQSEIMTSLLLSYQHLPDYLKPCFVYHSLVPKGWIIKKDDIITEWIVQGFVHANNSQRAPTSVGMEYMDELVNRSLFQLIVDENIEYITMHDLILDMARMMSKDYIFVIMDNNFTDIPIRVRHLSIYPENSQIDWKKITSQLNIRSLRSLRINGRVDADGLSENKEFMLFLNKIFCEGKHLRSLSLDYVRVKRISSSIGNLKLLRHLSLRGNPIKTLPKTLTNLYHLQYLDLVHSDLLETLPRQMTSLLNLRYFYGDHNLLNIGCFRNLKSLKKLIFQVSYTKEHTMNELSGLNEIRQLTIEGLENVNSKDEAMKAKLKDKKYLDVLAMKWSSSDSSSCSRNDEEVLEGLQPSPWITVLSIEHYQGIRCPGWISSHDLPNLRNIHISYCPQLKEFGTSNKVQESIQEIYLLFCGNLQGKPLLENDNFFPRSLSTLLIIDCGEFGDSLQRAHLAHFNCLKKLFLHGCANIEYIPTETLPSLDMLEVIRCKMLSTHEGMGDLAALASLEEVRIYECDKLVEDLVTRSVALPSSLKELYIGNVPKEFFFPVFLRRLDLASSEKVESLPIEVLRVVEHLRIVICPNLYPPRTLNGEMHSMNGSRLKHFFIGSTSVACLNEWLAFLKSSEMCELTIQHILELQSLSDLDDMLADLHALTHLHLIAMLNVRSLPSKLNKHPSLRFVELNRCLNIKYLSASMFAPSTELEIVICPQLLKRLPKKGFVEIQHQSHPRYLEDPAIKLGHSSHSRYLVNHAGDHSTRR